MKPNNPLMNSQIPNNQINNITNNPNFMNLIKLLRSGNINEIGTAMYNSNPQFRQFVDANKNKTPEQIAKEKGADINAIIKMI